MASIALHAREVNFLGGVTVVGDATDQRSYSHYSVSTMCYCTSHISCFISIIFCRKSAPILVRFTRVLLLALFSSFINLPFFIYALKLEFYCLCLGRAAFLHAVLILVNAKINVGPQSDTLSAISRHLKAALSWGFVKKSRSWKLCLVKSVSYDVLVTVTIHQISRSKSDR